MKKYFLFIFVMILQNSFLHADLLVKETISKRNKIEQKEDISRFEKFPEIPEATIKSFTSYIQNEFDDYNLPSSAIIITQGNEIKLLKILNNSSSNNLANEKSLFKMGQLSLPFISLLSSSLASEQKIDHNSTLKSFISNFNFGDNSSQITIASLLTMTAGIPTYLDNFVKNDFTTNDIVTLLNQSYPIAAPMQIYQFSKISICLAAFALPISCQYKQENLETRYLEVANKYIFEKANMLDSKIFSSKPENVLNNYEFSNNKYILAQNEQFATSFCPIEGLYISPRDMAKWLIIENLRGTSKEGKQIASINNMLIRTKPINTIQDKSHSMGFTKRYYNGTEIIFAQSQTSSSTAIICIFPKLNSSISILLNCGGTNSFNFAEDICLNFSDILRETCIKEAITFRTNSSL